MSSPRKRGSGLGGAFAARGPRVRGDDKGLWRIAAFAPSGILQNGVGFLISVIPTCGGILSFCSSRISAKICY